MSVPEACNDPGVLEPALTALALLYANGEMADAEAVAFEARLGAEQRVRDALCQAVELTQTLGGTTPCRPDPRYRECVREQLRATQAARSRGGWWSALLRPRFYRGHPAMWALGGALAAALVVVSLSLPRRSPEEAQPQPTHTLDAVTQPAGKPEPTATRKMAQVWAELNHSDHLERAWAEEQKRRHRAEERAGRGSAH